VAGGFTPLLADETVEFVAEPDDPFTIVVDAFDDIIGGSFDLSVTCEECVDEGGSHIVYPGAPDCCPGLGTISCESPDGDGNCPGSCAGATICANCPDGNCGPGENKCNCPADCPP
jgi:hypothetical protein